MLTLTLNRELRTPLQLQISQFYFQAIQRGGLLYGDRPPSTREQTQILNVAKATVVMAYDKLVAARLIKNRHGISYEMILTTSVRIMPAYVSVAQGSPPIRPRTAEVLTDVRVEPGQERYCRTGVSDPNAFPWSSWWKQDNAPSILKEQLFTQCHSPSGLFSLCRQLVRYFNSSRGVNTRTKNIIVASGAQEGLSLPS